MGKDGWDFLNKSTNSEEAVGPNNFLMMNLQIRYCSSFVLKLKHHIRLNIYIVINVRIDKT